MQLFSKAMGHLGGNDITAEFVRARRGSTLSLSVAVTGNDSVVNLATDADRRADEHRGPGRRRDQRQPGRERARDRVPVRRQRGRGRRPGPRAGAQLSDYLAAPAHVKRGPFDQRVLRIGKQRDGTKTGVFIYCQQHAREWVTPITCLETAERLMRNYATDPTTKELRRQPRHLHPAVGEPGRRRTTRSTTSASSAATWSNYCPLTADDRQPSAPQRLGRRPQPQQHRRLAVRRLLGASARTAPATPTPARSSSRSRRSATSSGSRTRSRRSSSRSTSTRTAATSCGRRARTSSRAARRCRRRTSASRSTSSTCPRRSCRTSRPRATRSCCRERTGPIADVLYSAAGNSADDAVVPQGHHRLLVRGGRGAHRRSTRRRARSRARRRRLPAVLRRARHARAAMGATCGTVDNPNPLLVNEGHDCDDGVRGRQLRPAAGRPGVLAGRHRAGRRRSSTRPRRRRRPDQLPVQLGRRGGRSSTTRPTARRRRSGLARRTSRQGIRIARAGADAVGARRPHDQVDRSRHQGQRLAGQEPAPAGRGRRR